MNSLLRTYPLRILLVENDYEAREDLKRYLKARFCFPCAEIEAVADRLHATAAIQASVEADRFFDCAILDLIIADKDGGEEYASSDLADYFVRQNPQEIWVVHWTAGPEDPEIIRFQAALARQGVTHLVVSKIPSTISPPPALQIREFLEQALVEKALGRVLDDPYFATEMGGNTWAVTIRDARRPQPPMNLAGFARLLADCWLELRPHRRAQALGAFAGSELEIVEHGGLAELRHERARQAALAWLERAKDGEISWR